MQHMLCIYMCNYVYMYIYIYIYIYTCIDGPLGLQQAPLPLPGVEARVGAAGAHGPEAAVEAFGWHYLSNATSLIRPHLFYALFSCQGSS